MAPPPNLIIKNITNLEYGRRRAASKFLPGAGAALK
jgi:hypothetical protein